MLASRGDDETRKRGARKHERDERGAKREREREVFMNDREGEGARETSNSRAVAMVMMTIMMTMA